MALNTILQAACEAALATDGQATASQAHVSQVRASQPVFLTAGWESDIYSFDLDYVADGVARRDGLVLRLYSGARAAGKASHEFGVTRGLHAAGYPVPRPRLWHAGGEPAAAPFLVMERIDGDVMWPLMKAASASRRAELIGQFCELAARLHQMDTHALEPQGSTNPYRHIDSLLLGARDMLNRHPQLGLQPALDWLLARRDSVPCLKASVLHWDFHPSNVIVRADGSAVVIDWTGGRISDARFDLAWTLLLTNAYAGSAMRDSVLAGYERHWGARVDQLIFFEVVACVRRLFDIGLSLSQGAEAMGMRAGAAEQMRQYWQPIERVYALLRGHTGLSLPAVEAMLAAL